MNRRERLIELGRSLTIHPRIAIAGGPLTGKSLVADQIGYVWAQIKTDDFMHLTWSLQPFAIISECERHERFCLSGVNTGRALRKGLIVDAAVFLEEPLAPLTPEQSRMADGCRSIFTEWHAMNLTVKVLYI